MHDRTLTESGHRLPGKLKRMTGRGGDGRDWTRWSATTRPVQRPVTNLREVLWDDRTRWWTLRPDAVVSNDASSAASGPAFGRCLTPFFNLIFDATSPNQVPIQRDSNKHQLESDMSDLTQTFKFFKVFYLRLVLCLRKYVINTRGATYGHAIEFMNP
jgi:hypothetical protein